MNIFLKEERNRLNLLQSDICEKINVGSATYIRWESGKPIPSDKLTLLAEMGFDVNYIITGVKDEPVYVGNGLWGDQEIKIGFQPQWLKSKGFTVNRLVLLKVSGNAMAPTFNAGEMLLIETFIHRKKTGNKIEIKQGLAENDNLQHDGVYLVRLNGRQTIRRIQLMKEGARIYSDNPEFKEFIMEKDELNERVLGKVVWHARDIG